MSTLVYDSWESMCLCLIWTVRHHVCFPAEVLLWHGLMLCVIASLATLPRYHLLDSLVVECWHRVREVPGSIPSQGPRHTKDVVKRVPGSSLVVILALSQDLRQEINILDKIWDRKSFEVGGHWLLWRGRTNRMTTQNRQKSYAKKQNKNSPDITSLKRSYINSYQFVI